MYLEAIQDQTASILNCAEVFDEQTFDDLINPLNYPELSILDKSIQTLKNKFFFESDLRGCAAFYRTGQMVIGSSLLSASIYFFTPKATAQKVRALAAQHLAITVTGTAIGAFCAAKIFTGRCRANQVIARAKIAYVAMRMQMIILRKQCTVQSQVLNIHTNTLSCLQLELADLRSGNEQNLTLNRQCIMQNVQLLAQCAQLSHVLSFVYPYQL